MLLDTNIIISAFGWEGKPKEIFRKITDGKVRLITSNAQLDEIKRVVQYPRLHLTEDQQKNISASISELADIVHTTGEVDLIADDPSDNMILETALKGNAKFIISGDEHLLKVKAFKGIKIVTATEYLSRLYDEIT